MLITLIIILIVLLAISAFFSGSETAMMSLNRYRLRHLARQKHRAASRAQRLLKRPDRLLGLILVGNTFANILASAIATLVATQLYGEIGALIATIILTILILIFSEVMPKTLAALNPEKFGFPASLVLNFLLSALYPIIVGINATANGILYVFGVRVGIKSADHLSKEELRSLVQDSKEKLKKRHRNMLLGVLDLEKSTIEDVLIPRSKMYAINLNDNLKEIVAKIKHSPYSKIPVYKGDIDNIEGVIYLRHAAKLLDHKCKLTDETIAYLIEPAYFIPENTSLQQQLINFQQKGEHFGVVVDEYGDIQGVASMEDIVEEIVGEYMNSLPSQQTIRSMDNGDHIVSGDTTVRDLNRKLDLTLSIKGPKTLNGLITEHLQAVPAGKTCIKIENQPMEILQVEDNAVKWVRVIRRTSS